VAPPAQVEPVEQPVVEPAEPAEMPDAEEEESEGDNPALSESLQKLVKKHESKVKSYKYFFSGPPLNQGGNHFSVVGDMIRVDITQSDVTLRLTYDTVFLNNATSEAVGYCLGDKLRCPDGPIKFDVSYDDYYEPLPVDWLSIIEYGETKSSMNIDNRKTKGVMFDRGGHRYTIYIDEFSGLPLSVVSVDGEEEERKYHYKDLSINSVDDDLVEPPEGY